MNSLSDQQLLREYAVGHSEPAFAELTRRHVDTVYSAALRMVRDRHLAEDVTQGAFFALAQSAPSLSDRPVLSGWLHRTAQYLASKAVRSEVRRRAREQEAVAMNEQLSGAEAGWESIAPHLDEAMGQLSEADRDALMLRYFERKSAHEMAQTLGITHQAAQKRLNRAVERLRACFASRGLTVGGATIAALISTNAVQSAPTTLAIAITSAAPVVGTLLAATATHTITMTALQKTLIATALIAAAGTGVYQARQASLLRAQVQSLQQQHAPLAEQAGAAAREREVMTRQLASLQTEKDRLDQLAADLEKRRADIARLRQEAQAASEAAKSAWSEVAAAAAAVPPVKTFIAMAQATSTWEESLVTGGWKLPNGNRAMVLVTPSKLENNQLTISSRWLEYTDEAGGSLGLAQYNLETGGTDGQRTYKTHKFTTQEFNALMELAGRTAGVGIIAAPSVTTLSGMHAQIQVTDAHTTPTGENYSTGPVLNLIPSIAPDGKSVTMVLEAQLNYATTPAKTKLAD